MSVYGQVRRWRKAGTSTRAPKGVAPRGSLSPYRLAQRALSKLPPVKLNVIKPSLDDHQGAPLAGRHPARSQQVEEEEGGEEEGEEALVEHRVPQYRLQANTTASYSSSHYYYYHASTPTTTTTTTTTTTSSHYSATTTAAHTLSPLQPSLPPPSSTCSVATLSRPSSFLYPNESVFSADGSAAVSVSAEASVFASVPGNSSSSPPALQPPGSCALAGPPSLASSASHSLPPPPPPGAVAAASKKLGVLRTARMSAAETSVSCGGGRQWVPLSHALDVSARLVGLRRAPKTDNSPSVIPHFSLELFPLVLKIIFHFLAVFTLSPSNTY